MTEKKKNEIQRKTQSKELTISQASSQIIEKHLSGEIKKQSVRGVAVQSPQTLRIKCAEALTIVCVYFEEFAANLRNETFIEVFSDAINDRYPNLLMDELKLILKKKMQTYKFHTTPRLNDIFSMIDEYMAERLEKIETHYHNEKVKESTISDEGINLLKKALQEAQDEMAEENEEKENAFNKAMLEAKNYHKHNK